MSERKVIGFKVVVHPREKYVAFKASATKLRHDEAIELRDSIKRHCDDVEQLDIEEVYDDSDDSMCLGTGCGATAHGSDLLCKYHKRYPPKSVECGECGKEVAANAVNKIGYCRECGVEEATVAAEVRP